MKTKLIYGAVNDADYTVIHRETTGCNPRKFKTLWICPYYATWIGMLRRCTSTYYNTKRPTYSGCFVCDEWKYFMNFRAWMIRQNWQNKQLDKDLIDPYNKMYGPDKCMFVDGKINSFVTKRQNCRGEYPIGVSLFTKTNKYIARCNDGYGNTIYLGIHDDPIQAHQAWQLKKAEIAIELKVGQDLKTQQVLDRIHDKIMLDYTNGVETIYF